MLYTGHVYVTSKRRVIVCYIICVERKTLMESGTGVKTISSMHLLSSKKQQKQKLKLKNSIQVRTESQIKGKNKSNT